MKTSNAVLPPFLVLDGLLHSWLLEDIGRGDRIPYSLTIEIETETLAQVKEALVSLHCAQDYKS